MIMILTMQKITAIPKIFTRIIWTNSTVLMMPKIILMNMVIEDIMIYLQ